MGKFLKLNTNLGFEIIEYPDTEETYPILRDAVDGLIAEATGYFDLPEGLCAFVNDEGLLLDLDPIMLYVYERSVFEDEDDDVEISFLPDIGYLVGNAVFVRVDEDGETVSLTDGDVETIKATILNMPAIQWDESVLLFKSFVRNGD